MAYSARFVAFALAGAAAALAVVSGGPSAEAQQSLRYGESVVVPGSTLTALAGSRASELGVWVWMDTGWQQLPRQVDERRADATYVAFEDGLLDGNDELVFPLPEELDLIPEGAWPDSFPRDTAWVKLRLTDPLVAGSAGDVLVLRLPDAQPGTPQPQIEWDAAGARLKTDRYELGFSDPALGGFVGVDRLALFGGGQDLVDRLKIRLTVRLPIVGEQQVTEQNLAGFLALAGMAMDSYVPDPVIAGPVRVVIDGNGAATATRSRLSLDLLPLDDVTLPTGLQLEEARISLDFSEAAAGARYSDANMLQPVTVDGARDDVPQVPLPDWRQVELAGGRLVFLRRAALNAATASVYYEDDASRDPRDGGDGLSFADHGVLADNLSDLISAGFPGEVVVIEEGVQIGAGELVEALRHPIEIAVAEDNRPEMVATPTASATSPVGASSTPVPTATATTHAVPTAAASASVTADDESAPGLCLPLLLSGR